MTQTLYVWVPIFAGLVVIVGAINNGVRHSQGPVRSFLRGVKAQTIDRLVWAAVVPLREQVEELKVAALASNAELAEINRVLDGTVGRMRGEYLYEIKHLREDLAKLDANARESDDGLLSGLTAISERIHSIEQQLNILQGQVVKPAPSAIEVAEQHAKTDMPRAR